MFLTRVFTYYGCVSSKRTLERVILERQNQPSSKLVCTYTCHKNHILLLPLNYEQNQTNKEKSRSFDLLILILKTYLIRKPIF